MKSKVVESLERGIDRAEREHQEQVADILRPSVSLLCKLASAIVHAEEYMSPGGHQYDLTAFSQNVDDPEVEAWMKGMRKAAFIPVKR